MIGPTLPEGVTYAQLFSNYTIFGNTQLETILLHNTTAKSKPSVTSKPSIGARL